MRASWKPGAGRGRYIVTHVLPMSSFREGQQRRTQAAILLGPHESRSYVDKKPRVCHLLSTFATVPSAHPAHSHASGSARLRQLAPGHGALGRLHTSASPSVRLCKAGGCGQRPNVVSMGLSPAAATRKRSPAGRVHSGIRCGS